MSEFGDAVALSSTRLAVGAPEEGTVTVYVGDGTTWQREAELSASDPLDRDFGRSVAFDATGDRLAVGAPGNSALFAFERVGGEWTQTARLTAPDTTCLGLSVALDGDRLFAGARCTARQVHVFEYAAGTWTAAEVIEGGAPRFGWAVDADQGRLAVATLGVAVDLYAHGPDGWTQTATVAAPSASADGFARSIDLDGGTLAVGAPSARPTPAETGAVYVFDEQATGWDLEATLTPADLSPLERQSSVAFGSALALADGRLVVGAPGDDPVPMLGPEPLEDAADPVCWNVPPGPTCQYPGAAYVYARSGDQWVQEAKLTGPTSPPTTLPRWLVWNARPDAFGTSVAQTGDNLVVGAPFGDVLPGDDTGAVHVFRQVDAGVVS